MLKQYVYTKSKKRKLINTALCVSYTWNTQAVRDYQHSTVDSFLMLFNVMLWEKIFVLNSSILLCIVMSLSVSMRQLILYFVCSSMLAYGSARHAQFYLPTYMKRCCGVGVVFCYSFSCWIIIISTWMSPQLHTEGGASDMLLAFNKKTWKSEILLFC